MGSVHNIPKGDSKGPDGNWVFGWAFVIRKCLDLDAARLYRKYSKTQKAGCASFQKSFICKGSFSVLGVNNL